jgi:hypothetical protein
MIVNATGHSQAEHKLSLSAAKADTLEGDGSLAKDILAALKTCRVRRAQARWSGGTSWAASK